MTQERISKALAKLERTLAERPAGHLEAAAARYWRIRQMSQPNRQPPDPPRRAA